MKRSIIELSTVLINLKVSGASPRAARLAEAALVKALRKAAK